MYYIIVGIYVLWKCFSIIFKIISLVQLRRGRVTKKWEKIHEDIEQIPVPDRISIRISPTWNLPIIQVTPPPCHGRAVSWVSLAKK